MTLKEGILGVLYHVCSTYHKEILKELLEYLEILVSIYGSPRYNPWSTLNHVYIRCPRNLWSSWDMFIEDLPWFVMLYDFYPTSCVFSRLRDRKHTMSWIYHITSQTMGYSFYHIPPHTCFCSLYSSEGVATQWYQNLITWVVSHWYKTLIDYLLFYVPLKKGCKM
jgi:hypothetical protein